MTKDDKKDDKKKEKKTMVTKDGEGILRVEPYYHFGKRMLLPYVKNECPIYLPKGQSEKKFYKLRNIRKGLGADNSELCRRLRFGLSFTAASMSEMDRFLQDNQENMVGNVQALLELFQKPAGAAFRQALATMNSREPEEELSPAEAVSAWWEFMKEDAEEKQKVLRGALMSSTRVQLGASAMLECLALSSKPEHWANSIDPEKLQPKAVLSWKKAPKSMSKAKKAMESVLNEGRDQQKKKRATIDGSSSDSSCRPRKRKQSSSSDDSDSSESSSAKKGQTKKKKNSKGRKKESESSSSSDSKSKKKKKKQQASKKKGKDKKKGTGKAKDSSSSSEATEKKSRHDKAAEAKKEEDKTAAFTLMKQSDAQALSAQVFEKMQSIGNDVKGKYPVEELRALKQELPNDIAKACPKLQKAIESLDAAAEKGEENVTNTQARAFILEMQSVLTDIESFYEQESAHTAAGSQQAK